MTERNSTAGQLTLNDVDLGIRLFEALAQHATASGGAPIALASLLTLGRKMYPKDVALDRAVPLGVPAKLGFIASFCAANGFPNLASLAMADSGALPAAEPSIAAFDWSGAQERLRAYAEMVRATVPKRLKPRKERPADVAWYAYFCSHRETCAQLDGEDKKEIINLLMAGLDPEMAMRRVLHEKADLKRWVA
jgi:hypothetical protein